MSNFQRDDESAILDQRLSEVDRTIEQIRNSASGLLKAFRSKLDSLKDNHELTEKLIRQDFDRQECVKEGIDFFGKSEVRYLAIDGTDFQDERLDMVIFYAGAFGYSGLLRFSDSDGVVAETPRSEDDSFSLSVAIPLSDEYTSAVSGESTEGGIEVDSERVPMALMRLAEYYLAYTAIARDSSVRALLLDRTVSGDIAHISWKMRDHIAQGRCFLEGRQTSCGLISKVDLELGRMLISNPDLEVPASRSHLLKFAAMKLLMDARVPMTAAQIASTLGAIKDREEKIMKELKDDFGEALVLHLDESGKEVVEVKKGVDLYWKRLLQASVESITRIFDHPEGQHPLSFETKGGERRWLTTEDLEYLTLVLIYQLVKEAWEKKILILGIVKDTTANELVHAVIPILEAAKLVRFEKNFPRFNSDKMLLQANSTVNSDMLVTPWRTFEYDVCFRTIIPQNYETSNPGEASVKGAFKNVITSERMFVKAYFQLWSSENDPNVRSYVFLYDRPCYPQYEMPAQTSQPELLLRHKDVVEEKIVPAMHFLSDSRISELVMGILYSMGTEPVPEALGHNYPLFLADKKAKWMEVEASKACSSAVELEVSRSKLDQQVLYENRFRDYRDSVESRRRSRTRGRKGF